MRFKEWVQRIPTRRIMVGMAWFYLVVAVAITAARWSLGLPLPWDTTAAAIGLPLSFLALSRVRA